MASVADSRSAPVRFRMVYPGRARLYAVGISGRQFRPRSRRGGQGASYSGLWIHDAVGLFVTPMALAIAYIVIPVTTGRPIFSHFLSMIGFWLLFLVYPLNGTHHYVFSSIPMEAQKGAIVASVYLGVAVIIVVANQLLSLRGAAAQVAADVPLRCVWVGIISYFVVSMQGSMQALMPVNRFVHFTDWVIGHAHLAMIGFASFTAIGGLLCVWSRTPGFRYNARAAEWAFWLLSVGLAVMVFDLTIAGLLQGQLWQSDAPWIDSVRASQPYWIVRSISGGAVVLAFLALGMSLLTGPRVVATVPVAESIAEQPAAISSAAVSDGRLAEEDEADEPAGLAWLSNAYVLTAVAGLGFFVFSFVVLAIWPNQVLQKQIAELRPAETQPLSAAEERGRLIYGREGCVNCHTQLVRFTEEDVRRFGVASQAWETDNDLPQLWGTRRVGPDLAREHARKSRDWQFAHLYNPRHVVPDSMMPPYSWLFDGAATKPTTEARDLVAYLNSLGRNAQLAGLNGPQPLPGLDPDEEKRKGMFCDCMIPRTLGTAPVFSVSDLEPSERERFARRGAEVFARNCAGCHGTGPRRRPGCDQSSAKATKSDHRRVFGPGLERHAVAGRDGIVDARLERPFDRRPPRAGGPRAITDRAQFACRRAPLSESDLTTVRKLFTANCVVCHGARGAATGFPPATWPRCRRVFGCNVRLRPMRRLRLPRESPARPCRPGKRNSAPPIANCSPATSEASITPKAGNDPWPSPS